MLCQVLYNELPKYNQRRRSSIAVATLRNLQLSRGNPSLFGSGSANSSSSSSRSSDVGHVYSEMSAAPRVRSSLADCVFDQ